ncbi:MAG TPA: DUF4352 domain-containing protein [Candidatus Lumbricidophila sp.]|nr:DUF4352 domain-containing protein [Candidatus Lumbricidophila sp.]
MSDNHSQAPTPPTPPTPAVPPTPAPAKAVHPLGWVALSAAAIGFVFACIPGALILGWILLPTAFILSIVALAVKGKKWPGVVALIASIIGTIVGVSVFFALAATAVNRAIDDVSDTSVTAPSSAAANDAAATKSAEPAKELGASRDNPAPIGSVARGKDWEVTVNSVTLAATDQVMKANQFNQKPEPGSEYILINVTAKYIGTDKAMAAFARVKYVTPDGVTIDGLKSFATAPDALDSLSELYNGASVTGNIALAVPSATAAQGVLVVTPGMLADDIYIAVK